MFGLGIALVLFNWKYILKTITGATEPGEAKREGFTFKQLWIIGVAILVIFYLYLVGVWMWSASIGALMLVYFLFLNLGVLNMKAESGFMLGYFTYFWHDTMYFHFSTGTTPLPMEGGQPYPYVAESFWTHEWLQWGQHVNMSGISMEGLKVADATKTSTMDVLKAYFFIIPVAALIYMVMGLQHAFTYGGEKLWTFGAWWAYGHYDNPDPVGGAWFEQSFGGNTVTFIWGAGLIIVLYFLRMTFIWFPVHPVGLVLAWGAHALSGIPSLIIWIVKYLIMKVGGTNLYNKTVPFMLGLGIGATLEKCLFSLHAYSVTLPLVLG
jgi:hypothetical protein